MAPLFSSSIKQKPFSKQGPVSFDEREKQTTLVTSAFRPNHVAILLGLVQYCFFVSRAQTTAAKETTKKLAVFFFLLPMRNKCNCNRFALGISNTLETNNSSHQCISAKPCDNFTWTGTILIPQPEAETCPNL